MSQWSLSTFTLHFAPASALSYVSTSVDSFHAYDCEARHNGYGLAFAQPILSHKIVQTLREKWQ